MKKAISWILAISLLFIVFTSASFINAQNKAEKIKTTFEGNLSELKGRLILFENKKLSPSWYFSAEYADFITGATFDIEISILGDVIRQPPKTKKI